MSSSPANALDLLSPTPSNIILSPVYNAVPGNVLNHPGNDGIWDIKAAWIIPKEKFNEAIADYKWIKLKNTWFADFCNSWNIISDSYGIDIDARLKLFKIMYNTGFLSETDIWINEYIGSFWPEINNFIVQLSQWKDEEQCKKIAEDLIQELKNTQPARMQELKNREGHQMNIIKIIFGWVSAIYLAFFLLIRALKKSDEAENDKKNS